MLQHAALGGRGRTLAGATTGSQRCVRARVATPAAPPPPTQSQRSFDAQTNEPSVVYGDEVIFSGLNGKALQTIPKWPSKQEVFDAIPKHCYKKDTFKSMTYAVTSLALTAACVTAGTFIPFNLAWAPAWAAYAGVTGTVAMGMWIVAHECGHRAFSDNTKLQDAVGYLFHTLLLVPYFSWQRSHAVHHARVNHMNEGESFVPDTLLEPDADGVRLDGQEHPRYYTEGNRDIAKRQRYAKNGAFGKLAYGVERIFMFLTFGWPVYLLTGASGGPVRGTTSHFDPRRGATGQNALFPGKFAKKVWNSDIGIGAVIAGLVALGVATGNPAAPLLLYAAPLAVVNAWLIVYTWLHHTDTDVPHFSSENWHWAKGAFMTIDRPYGPIANFLHHGIGSTHVVHHINHEIPHYHAWEASAIIKEKFPDIYLYDPTPIPAALWRVAQNCVAVEKKDGAAGAWVYTNGDNLKPDERAAVAAPQLQP